MSKAHRVLVVDDDEDIRNIVAEILRDEGYLVDEAENGRDAMDRIGEMHEEPCLVLLDMMMPEMNGVEVLAALSRQHRLAAMPVVVLSAQALVHAQGARRILRKPLSREALLTVVREFCDPCNLAHASA